MCLMTKVNQILTLIQVVMNNLVEMQTALRVLTAITEKQNPDPKDIEALRQIAPSLADVPPDELACGVIQQALKRRAEIRTASGGS